MLPWSRNIQKIGNQIKGGNSVGILLSDLLACRELEEFEGEEEEDVKADPIHDIDICEYVSKSMLSVSQTQIAQVWFFSVPERTKLAYLRPI